MRKEVRQVDPQRGIMQITTLDERFYARQVMDPVTGIPSGFEFRPSVTWICSYYPMGKGFQAWLKRNGDEADEIAALAAQRGYKVHRAIALLNDDIPVHPINYITPSGEAIAGDMFDRGDGVLEELTPEECLGVMSYVQWWEDGAKDEYEILGFEYTTWPNAAACSEKYGLPEELFEFAGTVDLKVRRREDQTIGIIDMKTSPDIWPSHECQVSAYKRAEGADWCALLQLNYRRNKTKKYKFTMVEDCFDLFAATKRIWKKETGDTVPLQRDYPLELRLTL